MNLLKDNIRAMYIKYLAAAFGSSFISIIYGFVDSMVIGKYEGPSGLAAMAVIAPIWNIIFSLGLLFGIGASVFFSSLRARKEDKEANEYFTVAVVGAAIFSGICMIALFLFEEPILNLFGADESMISLCKQYLLPVKFVVFTYLFTQVFAAFLRNDGNPGLATLAVLCGGIFNVFGDVYFVFGLDMGMLGAGLATAMGNTISLIVMCGHFFHKKNTLRLVRVKGFAVKAKNVIIAGFSSFFVDVAMGIVTALLNNQIMKYMGANALAVYAVIVNLSTCVQCSGYSVGQAAQPILSANLGAGLYDRIKQTLRYAIYASVGFAAVWTIIMMCFPNQIVNLMMNATPEVLSIAPGIIRLYSLSFILLPLNVFSTYYFQSLMKPGIAFAISIARGAIISGGLILLLPMLLGATGLWLAMPFAEGIVFIGAVYFIRKYTKELGAVNA